MKLGMSLELAPIWRPDSDELHTVRFPIATGDVSNPYLRRPNLSVKGYIG
jgi:hypothetical protein